MPRKPKPTVFKDLLRQAADANLRGRQAMLWLRKKAQQTQGINVPRLMWQLHEQQKPTAVIGSCYLYSYDPKWKKELPYYDSYPVVFPIEKYPDGFLGLNFHYLPYNYRAALLDALYRNMETNQKLENLQLRMSYGILKSFSKFNLVKPTVHRYLNDHVRSNFIWVPASEWDVMIFLPLARFKKASQEQVWADSIKKSKGR